MSFVNICVYKIILQILKKIIYEFKILAYYKFDATLLHEFITQVLKMM